MKKLSEEEISFLNKLRESPNDEAIRLVYADWLDENNQADKAHYLRTLVKVRNDFKEYEEARKQILEYDWADEISGAEEGYDTYIAYKGLTLPPLERLSEMITNAATVGSGDFNLLLGDTIREKYESLYMRLNEIMNIVLRKASKDGDAWLCTSPEIASIFETVSYAFKPCEYFVPFRKLKENQSPQYNGILAGRFRVYTHPLFSTEMILFGIGRGELPPENLGTFRLFNFVF